MSSSLLLQQCPACLVRLIWIVFVMGGTTSAFGVLPPGPVIYVCVCVCVHMCVCICMYLKNTLLQFYFILFYQIEEISI